MGILMRFPGGRAKALTLSYDDGVQQDEKLIGILDRSGIRCTFNLNSGLFAKNENYPPGQIHRRMTREHCAKLYNNSAHEVAVHSLTHPFLEELSGAALAREILADRENLEALSGGAVRGMAYPFGTYNSETVRCLRECGIAYSRTTKATHGFEIPEEWLTLDPTCHHIDPALDELCTQFLELDIPAGRKAKMFYLWGHSYEFEADDNWDVIERFAENMGGHDDIWYATNIEIYDYVKAYRALTVSCDSRYIENPSAADVWFAFCGTIYCIKGGECLRI